MVCLFPPQRFFQSQHSSHYSGERAHCALCALQFKASLVELRRDCGVDITFCPLCCPFFSASQSVPDALLLSTVFCMVSDKTWMHTPEALAKHYISYNAKVGLVLFQTIITLGCDQKERGFILWHGGRIFGFWNASKLKWEMKTNAASFPVWPIALTPGVPLNILLRALNLLCFCIILFCPFSQTCKTKKPARRKHSTWLTLSF